MASYLEIAALKDNTDFRARVGVAIIRYAAYVLGDVGNTDFREYKVNWARRALIATDDQVYRVMGFVLGNPTVQTQLAGIADTELQGIVEYQIRENMASLT